MREMKMRILLLIFLLNFQSFSSGCFLVVDHWIMDDCAFNQPEALSIAIVPLPMTLLCALVLVVIYCYSRSRAVKQDAAITTPSPEPQQKGACQCGIPGSARHFGDRTGPVGSAYFKWIGSIDRKALATLLMRLQFIDNNNFIKTGNVEELLEEALLEIYKKNRWPPKTYAPAKSHDALRKDIKYSANISSVLAPVNIESESLSTSSTESIKEPEIKKMRSVKITAHVRPTPAKADNGVKKERFACRMKTFFQKLLGFFLCCRIIRE